jgi:hypothetical protein
MSIDSDFDPDVLFALLAGPQLPPHLAAAFRRAADEALARLPSCGEAAGYRDRRLAARILQPAQLRSRTVGCWARPA